MPKPSLIRHLRIAAVPVVMFLLTTASQADISPVERGRAFAQEFCGKCHAIGLAGKSPQANAPAFRVLHKRYPVESLAESLAEGIGTGHPAMPEFELEPAQIDDLIAYLKSLER